MKNLSIFIFILSAIITGCSRYSAYSSYVRGDKSLEKVTEISSSGKMVIGVTTENEVREMLGEPTTITDVPCVVNDHVEEGTRWSYTYIEGKLTHTDMPFFSLGSEEVDSRTLYVIFNKNKKLNNYYVGYAELKYPQANK